MMRNTANSFIQKSLIKHYLRWFLGGGTVALLLIILGENNWVESSAYLNGTIFVFIVLSVLIISWKRPREMFWLFILALPLENIIISPQELPFRLRPFQLLGVSLLLAELTKRVFFKKGIFCYQKKLASQSQLARICRKAVGLLPLLAFLAIFNTSQLSLALKQVIILISFGAFYWLASAYLQKAKAWQPALWFFLLGGCLTVGQAIYQAVAQKMGWPTAAAMEGRVNASFTEPDWLGIYLTLLLAIILWLKILARNWHANLMVAHWQFGQVANVILNFFVFLVFWVLLLTVSRSAWLGAGTVLLAYFGILMWCDNFQKGVFKDVFKVILKEGIVLALIAVLVVVFTILSGFSTFHFANRAISSLSGKQKITISCPPQTKVPREINNTQELKRYNCRHINLEEISREKQEGREVKEVYRPDPNVEIRKHIYQTTWQAIKKHPWLGQGLGSAALILGKDTNGQELNASNLFLEAWLGMGMGGLLIMLFLFFIPLVWALKAITNKKPKLNDKGIFIILTTLAFLIPNLFNAGLMLGIFWIWLAVVNVIMEN